MARMLFVVVLVSLSGCKLPGVTNEVKTELIYEPGPQPSLKGFKVVVSASEKW